MNLCSYNPKTRNERCVMPVHHGFFVLFQFSEDFIGTHAFGKQLFQNGFCFCLFGFFCSFGVCLCLFCFQRCHFFFGLLQSSLLRFQISLQSVNVCGDGCDFRCECFLRGLLFRNLRCKNQQSQFWAYSCCL